MKKLILVFLVVIAAILFICHLRYPFVWKHKGNQVWSVGYGVDSKDFIPSKVISYTNVKDSTDGHFIADPFLFKTDTMYYLFVEIMRENGDIAFYQSRDFNNWSYKGVIIDEKFHISFPHVFNFDGKTLMIPETQGADNVIMYEAKSFPFQWEVSDTLIHGKSLADPALLQINGGFYLFGTDQNSILHCYYSDSLFNKGFMEHKKSPLGIGNRMRCAGIPFVHKQQLVLPVQDRSYGYGSNVDSYVIDSISPDYLKLSLGDRLVDRNKMVDLLQGGVHHLNVLYGNNDKVLFAVDGRAGTNTEYTRLNVIPSLKDNLYDLMTVLGIIKPINFLEK